MTDRVRVLRRIAVTVVGITVLAIGVALIVLPGPAVIVVPAGIAILATEYVWARRLLRRLREQLQRARAFTPLRGAPRAAEPAACLPADKTRRRDRRARAQSAHGARSDPDPE